MDEYIERGALYQVVSELPSVGGCSSLDRDSVENAIMEAPTADVVEVRNGEWESKWLILANAIYFNCSLCGESDPWQGTGRGRAKYCPNCGAKMDGERK